LHVQIGFLSGSEKGQTFWKGSRQGGVDKKDYPTKNAEIYVLPITDSQTEGRVRDIFNKVGEGEKWNWVLKDGNGETSGNCVQFACNVLEKMGVMDSISEPGEVDFRKATIAPIQLEGLLQDRRFELAKTEIATEVTNNPEKKLEDCLKAWEINRDLWNCNHDRSRK
jgi:hypothetical protein